VAKLVKLPLLTALLTLCSAAALLLLLLKPGGAAHITYHTHMYTCPQSRPHS
jgi:hypothetical protein